MGSYDLLLGPLLMGIFFNTYLYGLVTYQFAAYCSTKFNDRLGVKCMILFLFIVDTFQSASVIYVAWYYLVTNYNNPSAIGFGAWPYIFIPGGTAVVALVTQLYLGFRIWRFTNNVKLYGVIIALAVPSFAFGMAACIEAWVIKSNADLPRVTPIALAWLSTQVAVDVFITVTLTIVFIRSRTGVRRMDTILRRLIVGAVQTGFFTGSFSLAQIVVFSLIPNGNLYGAFGIPIGRIYTNTLLHSLLSRESLGAKVAGTYNIDTLRWAPATDGPSVKSTTSVQINVPDIIVMQTISDHPMCKGAEGKDISQEPKV